MLSLFPQTADRLPSNVDNGGMFHFLFCILHSALLQIAIVAAPPGRHQNPISATSSTNSHAKLMDQNFPTFLLLVVSRYDRRLSASM